MKETSSVYELKDRFNRIFEIMARMKIIMVKGIGYIVVNKQMTDPALFRRMGEVVAVAHGEVKKEEPPAVRPQHDEGNFTRVVDVKLSDKSIAHNVEIHGIGGGVMTIPCYDEATANQLVEVMSNCSLVDRE